ncbi:hypothetical protein [Aquimarina longa]|uniref:hypothetical protein n=1 Tax=Aquimarina longa TaxID=1080221 RepID=UPI0007810C3D|nr:hypothetical protein [Aquimarina longa]
MKNIFIVLSVGVIAIGIMIGCSSNDESSGNETPDVLLIKEGKLLSFPLFSIQSTTVAIVDPKIVDNKEVKYGEIKITVPSTTDLDKISASITSSELNLSKFSISPSNDVQLSYTDEKINVYTITKALGSKEELLHYNVSIVKEVVVQPETLKITKFTFEKSKNPSLPNDIGITKVIEDTGLDKIYVFVPLGTDFTDLVPTITYDGAKLYYSQDSSQAPNTAITEYPATGKSINFKYPNPFILSVKDRNNKKSKTTTVIVDVVNPLKVETISVTTPDVIEGNSKTFVVTKWINQGNHMLVYGKADTQENQNPSTPTQVIRVRRTLPPAGLIPGESAAISATVIAKDYPEGTYKTTAVFYPRLKYNEKVDDVLQPAKLNVTAKIVK